MFPIFQECSEELKELLKEPAGRGEIVEMKEIAGRFTTDVVSLFAFGIHTNSLKNPDAIIRKMGRKIFTISNVKYTKDIIKFFIPKLGALIGVSICSKIVSGVTVNSKERYHQKMFYFRCYLLQKMWKSSSLEYLKK